MAHLVNKSALVAEIKRRRSKNARNKLNLAAAFEDDYLLSFLDTLEVKEVDLEKEIETQWNKFVDSEGEIEQFSDIAKHFFELGLKAKEK